MFYILFIFGLLIRLFLIPLPGFKADMAFWKGWGLAIADKGIIWTTQNTNYNYPPGFAYVLYLVNKIYAFIANPYDSAYWNDNNLLYLFLFKMITIIADILIVFLIIKIAQRLKSNLGLILGLIYFLNPVVIFDGAFWGQVDQFGLLLFLLTFYLLILEKINLASLFFIVACLMKFQNIIFIPLFYLYILKRYSWQKLIDSVKISVIVFILINASFFIQKRADLLVRLLVVNNNYFPYYSLNAFNIWWIFSGLDGMKLTDTNLFLGIMTARNFSVLLFAFFYSQVAVLILKSDKDRLLQNFILGSAVLVFSFFHLLTQSHERYLFPLVGLLPLLIIYLRDYCSVASKKSSIPKFFDSSGNPPSRGLGRGSQVAKNLVSLLSIKRRFLKEVAFYVLFSMVFFFNVYLCMVYNYPEQVFWPFSYEVTRTISLLISVVQIVIFGYFYLYYFLPEIVSKIKYVLILGLIFVAVIFYKNFGFLIGKPVLLTSISPLKYTQEYSVPTYNKNLNANYITFTFGRISSNYFFYDQGIASHANSAIVYNLNRNFSKFKTDYGIETEGTANAEVYFIIEGDGRELFRSEKKGRFDNPSTAEVDISQVNQLVLKIERTGESNYGHHADWLEPVLIRK